MKTLNKILNSIGWFMENHPYLTIFIAVLLIMIAIVVDAIINAETLPDDHPENIYDDSKSELTNYYKNK